jgi:hypothetical protein
MPPRKRQKATRLIAWPGRDAAPLHERFAPRTAKDLRVYPKTVERVRAWLRRATGRAPDPGGFSQPRLLILAGPAGVGKSATLDVLCREEQLTPVTYRDSYGLGGDGFGFERRPSDFNEPRYESQMDAWARFVRSARYKPLSDDRPAVFVLDDFPTTEGYDDGTSSSRKAFRSILEEVCRSRDRAPCILIISGEISEKSDTSIVAERLVGESVMMSPHSELIEFLPVTEKKLRKLLDEVSEGAAWPRKPTIDAATLDALAVAARGDLRKCLSTLEIALRGGSTDPAATHKSDAGVSDVHAVRRICRGGSAKRDADGKWVDSHGREVDPDATVMNSKMGPDAFATFVQFNGASDFQSIEDLAEAWRTLSDAELLSARVYVLGRENDAIYPLQYVASLTGRAILVANRRPTPPSFKPARCPKYYDVRASLKLKKFDRRILDAPPRMAMRLGERSYDVLQDEASDVSDIEDSEDENEKELLAPQPFDEDAMFEAAAAALDAAEAAERERAAAASPAPPPPVPVAPAPAPPVTFESTAPPAPTRERAPPAPPVSQAPSAAPPERKRKKCILDTSSDEDEPPAAAREVLDLTADE